jgi:hypothetical protein
VPLPSPTCRFTRLTPKDGEIRIARGVLQISQDEDRKTPKMGMEVIYTPSGWEIAIVNNPKPRPEQTVLVTNTPLRVGDTVDLKAAADLRSELLRPLRPDHLAIERLANEYGFSSTRLQNFKLSDGSQAWGEPVDSWIELIFMHRIVAAMLTARDREDPAILRNEIADALTWEQTARTEPPSRYMSLFGRESASGELTWSHLLGTARMMLEDLEGSPIWADDLDKIPMPVDEPPIGRIPNKHSVEVLINMALSPTQLAVHGRGSDTTLGIAIIGARPASWASLVYSLASGRIPSTCEHCGRLMSPHAASKPGYRRFCSDSCRVRQSRTKKRAESLKAKGRSRSNIAKELGLNIELVRRWFP